MTSEQVFEMWRRVSRELFAGEGMSVEVVAYLDNVGHQLQNGVDPRDALGFDATPGPDAAHRKRRKDLDDNYLLQVANLMHEAGQSWEAIYRALATVQKQNTAATKNKILRLRKAAAS